MDDSAVRAVIMSASQEVYIVEIVYSDGLMTWDTPLGVDYVDISDWGPYICVFVYVTAWGGACEGEEVSR